MMGDVMTGQKICLCMRCGELILGKEHCGSLAFPLAREPFALLEIDDVTSGRSTTCEDLEEIRSNIVQKYEVSCRGIGLTEAVAAVLLKDLQSRLDWAVATLSRDFAGKSASTYVAFLRTSERIKIYDEKEAARGLVWKILAPKDARNLKWRDFMQGGAVVGGGLATVVLIASGLLITVGGFSLFGITILAGTPLFVANPLLVIPVAGLAAFVGYMLTKLNETAQIQLKKALKKQSAILACLLNLVRDKELVNAYKMHRTGRLGRLEWDLLLETVSVKQGKLTDEFGAKLKKGFDTFVKRRCAGEAQDVKISRLIAALNEHGEELDELLTKEIRAFMCEEALGARSISFQQPLQVTG